MPDSPARAEAIGRHAATAAQRRHTLNRQVAAASLAQQRRLLQQLVEAQQELRRMRQAQQQAEALRQQDAWRQQAQRAASGARVFAAAGAAARATHEEAADGARYATAAHKQGSHHHAQRAQHTQRSSMHRQHHRQYDVPIDVDDCWGRGAGGSSDNAAGASAAGGRTPGWPSGGGSRSTAHKGEAAGSEGSAWWQEFAHETADGFRYQSYRSAAQQREHEQVRQEQRRQQQQQQQTQQRQQQMGGHEAAPVAASGTPGVEQEVRVQLGALLQQSGGDLVLFVAALGVPFERGADRRASLRNARAAALLRLHPDKLLQQGERQQLVGLHATRLVNELWRASRPHT